MICKAINRSTAVEVHHPPQAEAATGTRQLNTMENDDIIPHTYNYLCGTVGKCACYKALFGLHAA